MVEKKTCDRCGSCCLQGGPALHGPDISLLKAGKLARHHLVTIRKGELALQPFAEKPTPVTDEFLKLQGRRGSWRCLFYDEPARACTIYEQRPVACGLFDCTAPEPMLAITGKDLLTRYDCIDPDDPLLPSVQLHDREFPCPDMAAITTGLNTPADRATLLAELTLQVNAELVFRGQLTAKETLSVAAEMFYFGRPLFQLLLPLGVRFREMPDGLLLL